MNIAIVGNCQARPVGHYLSCMCPEINLLPETIVHLSSPESAPQDLSRLDQANLIIAQSVQDGYHASHLATNALRERYGDKVIVWPNLFFNGNCADLAYLTSEDNERLQGPLGAYHNKFVFECWKNNIDESQALDALDSLYSKNASELSMSVEKSLEELHKRDLSSDVNIAEYISSRWQEQRLFFTFNHPAACLLVELSRQIAEVAGLSCSREVDLDSEHEPLDPIIPANNARVASILGLHYPADLTSKGVGLSVEQKIINFQGTTHYSYPELIRSSYAAYSAQPSAQLSVRITPRYAVA